MADFNATLMKQIFDIAERQRKSNIHLHGKANDLRARFETTKWGGVCHPEMLGDRSARLQTVTSDSAVKALAGQPSLPLSAIWFDAVCRQYVTRFRELRMN